MTQSPIGMFEYSFYPMKRSKETYYDLFPGDDVFTYLDDFSQLKRFVGKTIKERVKFASTVKTIQKGKNTWILQTESDVKYTCRKLIMAVGVTSTPRIPNFINHDFQPPIIHTKELASKSPFLHSTSVQDVVLLGGSKSAFDAAQMLTKAGKRVQWIIRVHGQGPALLAAPDAPPPLSNSHEIISLGLISAMNPCIFQPMNAWTRFFHQSRAGIWITATMWKMVNSLWLSPAKYDRSDNFKKLRPDRTAFWSSENIGVSNSRGIWDQLAKATIYRDEIDYLEGTDVILASGKRLKCDALVTCTGWDTTYPMFSKADALDLGLPLPLTATPPEELEKWDARLSAADKVVLSTFPCLANPPSFPEHAVTQAPSRLYRFIVPSTSSKIDQDHSIVFLGSIGTTQGTLVGEIQSLWASAYLMGDLKLPDEEKMVEQVALATAWRRRRYLGDGHTFLYEQIQVRILLTYEKLRRL